MTLATETVERLRPPRFARAGGAFRRSLSTIRHDEARGIGWLLCVIFGYLIFIPTVILFVSGFRVQFVDSAIIGEKTGSLTLHYLWETFVSPISRVYFWQPLEHTCTTAIGAVTVAVIVGGGLAWCVGRIDFPGRRLLAPLLLLPYIIPSWAVAQAWLTTFHNMSFGGSPGVLEGLGVEPPTWIAAGAVPIIIVLGIHLAPFVFLLASGGLRAIGAELEEAAEVLGGRRGRILATITAPLLLPALCSAGALVFAQVLGDFGTAYLLGLPVHYNTLATSLYANLQTDNMGVVAVLASVVVVLGGLAILLEGRFSGRSARFAPLRQTSPVVPRRTERWSTRVAASLFVAAVTAVGAGMPLVVLISSTFTKIPGRLGLSNFTLSYWLSSSLPADKSFPHGLLRSDELWSAAWNSVRIMGIAALVCGTVGLVAGYVVTRARGRFVGRAVRQLSFLPYLIPGISLAAAYILLFDTHRGPIPALYGSLTLLLLAMVVLHLPYSSRSAIAAFSQTGRAPEEAARVQGASFGKTMVRIVFPMQLRAFVTGVTLAFVSGLKELNVVIMLTLTSAGLLTTLAIELDGDGYTQLANGVTLFIVVLALAGYLLLKRLSHIDLTSSFGGPNATSTLH